MGRRWSEQLVLEAIKSFTAAHGRPPRTTDWASVGASGGRWPHYSTVVKLFGSWNGAIRAAGYAPRSPGSREQRAATCAPARALGERGLAVTRLYGKGLNAHEVANVLGLSETTVLRTLHEAGVTPRSLPGDRFERKQRRRGRALYRLLYGGKHQQVVK